MNSFWDPANKLAIVITILTGITGVSIYNMFISEPDYIQTPGPNHEEPVSGETNPNFKQKPEPEPEPEPVTYHLLNDMHFLSQDREHAEIGTFTSNYGDKYYDSYVVSTGFVDDGYVTDEIVLKGKYSRFTAILAPTEKMSKVKAVSKYGAIRIIGDGKTILEEVVNSNSDPVPIDIDISGVNKLKILIHVVDSSRYNQAATYYIGLGDIKFHLN